MTYDEWKNLVKEYRETDSISRRSELKETAADEATALCLALEKLYNHWGFSFVDEDDYQIGRGAHSLRDFNEVSAQIIYSDHWRYGGSCSFSIDVPMHYLDNCNLNKKNVELREERIKKLTSDLNASLESIENMKRECEKIRAELYKLDEERKSDPYSKGVEDGK